MKIYTSYFGNLKKLKENNIVPIGICCYPPKDFHGSNLIAIAPTPDILNNCRSNHQEFRKRYKNEVLYLFKDPSIFVDRIKFISNGNDCALCCFEKPDEFCHRHLVAYWLEECMGIAVDEVKVYNQKLVKLNRPEYLRCMLLDEIK